MSLTMTKEMVAKAQQYADDMGILRNKLQPYINSVEDTIFGDVAYDLVGDVDIRPEEVYEAEETIQWVLDKKNFSKLQSALHKLFNEQKNMYFVKDADDYEDWDYVDKDGKHYTTDTEPGESYDLYAYME